MCDGEYFGADVVFVGRVTRIARRGRGKGRALIRFAVERGYRGLGAKDAEVEVASAEGVGAAGHGFRVGETYLVHADASYSMKRLDLSTLTVSAKTPARLAAEAREELACIEERKRLHPATSGPH
ncbi:MAG TPA: hypothetical protein VFX96_15440, partial [Pyrinomonadaceae bacterium]|nr:hypothetical protein [Pyrinomonadaceae bacterium]